MENLYLVVILSEAKNLSRDASA